MTSTDSQQNYCRNLPFVLASFLAASLAVLCSATALYAQQPMAGGRTGVGLRIDWKLDPRATLHAQEPWRGLAISGMPSLADSVATEPTGDEAAWTLRFYGSLEVRRQGRWVHKVSLDPDGRYVVANESFLGHPLRLTRYMPLEEYISYSTEQNEMDLWRDAALENIGSERRGGGSGGGLNIEIPVEIKSRAFQKIFGGDRVGLNVQGDIRIDGGFRSEDRSEVRTSIAQGSNTNFKMNQTQRFTVTGKIGEKVTVNVDQDSERTLDFENNIRLNYKGFEDEIIQSIEAGNISLSLPATRFVTFSGKSTGLFGIKMNMQLGDLHLTTIASQEKGESQKLSVGGGASENVTRIEDYRYLRYTYFFLGDFYRRQYRRYADKWQHIINADSTIRRIEVYKSRPGYQSLENAIEGFAIPNPADSVGIQGQIGSSKEYYQGNFVRLEPNVDYDLFDQQGYLRMAQRVSEDEVLAVAYETASGVQVGDIDYVTGSGRPIFLKIIKALSPQASYQTWPLEWKNVYYLGGRNIEKEGLEIKILRRSQGSGIDQESQDATPYIELFGLDVRDITGAENPDGQIDVDNANIINLARGELIFPNLRPFDPDTVFLRGAATQSQLRADSREPQIYDTTSTRVISENSNFYLQVKSSSRSSTYNLGFNVIEGSEEVTLNGRRLQRGSDYTIDYWSGTLTILDESATLPTANVDITFERNQLFALQKKTILGTRAEYRFNENSFIGGTLLYLNERTLDQKVRVGSGPMRNIVWDINTSLKFQPNFLTRLVDALPLVSAQAPSTLNFEGEIAQVLPNPNTLNSSTTGDNQGVAYIDDFEGAKRSTPLGIQRRGWTLASAPRQKVPGDPIDEYMRSAEFLGRLIWYNPFGGVPTRQIWPNREVNSQTGTVTDVLTMEFTPEPRTRTIPPNLDRRQVWGGIMRALSPGFFDQTESKFLEIMVQGGSGILRINLGQISEDVIPNKRLDTEDVPGPGGIRDRILDPSEDVGLDGMANNDPRAVAAGGDFWDINGNGIQEPWEPYSFDDWSYVERSNDYRQINGTENNANDGIRIPDTEDINNNGAVDLVNNYFEYKINLDKFSPDTVFIAGGQDSTVFIGGQPRDIGWYLYRIPLSMPDTVVGSPDLTLIEYARLWVDGVIEPINISIAEISLVGNEWRELNPNDERLAIAVINTHDNPDYRPPEGVEGVRDRITQVRAKEQSLVLKVNELEADSTVLARKSFFEPQNYIRYERMRMYVYGSDFTSRHIYPTVGNEPDPSDIDKSDIMFFLRFGSNDNNYYEVRELVFGGAMPQIGDWDARNEIDINLAQLTNLKLDTSFVRLRQQFPDSIFEVQVAPTQWFRIRGEPSLTNVRSLAIGVRNTGRLERNIRYTGEIWINELRLSNIEKEKGMAMRARMDLSLSDFISVNAELNKQDADFHNVATRFGTGDNQLAGTVNGNMRLDRMLPRSWGLSMPLTMNYSQSNATPKWIPGKDILITPDTDPEEIERVRSRSKQRGFSLSFSRTGRSNNFFVKHTVDNIRANLSQTLAEQQSTNIDSSRREVWSGNLDYNLQFGQRTFIKPLAYLRNIPLLKRISETKFYYTPRNFSTRFQGSSSRNFSRTRQGAVTNVFTYDITRGWSTNYKIFENLSANLSRNATGDFSREGLMGLFTGEFEDRTKSQNFKVDYSPELMSWLTTRFSYTANYRFTKNISQPDAGNSANTNSNISGNFTLKFSQLFGGFTRQSPGRRRAPPGRERTPPGQRPGPGQQGDGQEEEKKEEDDKGIPNPLMVLKFIPTMLSKFQDINVTVNRRENFTNLGLRDGQDPSLAYQLGFSRNPDVDTVGTLVGNIFTENVSTSIGANTGLKVSRYIDIRLSFTHDEQNNLTSQRTGNYSTSFLKLGSETDADNKEEIINGIPFPEWTVNITGLEKLPLFSKFAKSASMSTNFTSRRSVVWRDSRDQKTKEDASISFRPLVRLSLTWKNDMQSNLQIDRTRGFNFNLDPRFVNDELLIRQTGATRTTQENIQFTTTYSKRSGFRIPLPFLKNNELKNSIDFSLTFSRNQTRTEIVRGDGKEFQESDFRQSWTIEPRATYSFSNRVRGGMFFQVGKTRSRLTGDVSIKEFGIDVNISIRGG